MLEEKQGQFWNLHQIHNKTSYPDFQFIIYIINKFLKLDGICKIEFWTLFILNEFLIWHLGLFIGISTRP